MVRIQNKKQKGFTLVELLVVIAIISLLSSVVLSSLNSARTKAKDATIKSQLAQMAILMNLNYSDYGTYCHLNGGASGSINGWIPESTQPGYIGSCNAFNTGGISGNPLFGTGIYANKAVEICKVIYNNAAPHASNMIHASVDLGSCTDKWSFMARLNNGKWYCSGSSGRGEYASSNAGNPGCSDNP